MIKFSLWRVVVTGLWLVVACFETSALAQQAESISCACCLDGPQDPYVHRDRVIIGDAVRRSSMIERDLRMLVIRVDFEDLPGAPRGLSGEFDASSIVRVGAEVSDYLDQVSYGRVSLALDTNDVTSVLRMPETAEHYAQSPLLIELMPAAYRAAETAGYRLNDYRFISVVFSSLSSVPGNKVTYRGWAYIGGSTSWFNGSFDPGIVAHEVGHSLGLYHANRWEPKDATNPIDPNGQSIEYGDFYDLMGQSSMDAERSNHFNPASLNLLGWLPTTAIRTVKRSGLFRLYRFDDRNADLARLMAIEVPINATQSYWIGYRYKPVRLRDGVIVVRSDGPSKRTQLLDLQPAVSDPRDVALKTGHTFVDPDLGMVLTVGDSHASGANAYIELGLNFVNETEIVPAVVSLGKSQYFVQEDAGNVTLTLLRDRATGESVSVDWETVSGTATDSDFELASGRVNWGPNDLTEKTIEIRIHSDDTFETTETFTVELRSPVGALLGAERARVDIINVSPSVDEGASDLHVGSDSDPADEEPPLVSEDDPANNLASPSDPASGSSDLNDSPEITDNPAEEGTLEPEDSPTSQDQPDPEETSPIASEPPNGNGTPPTPELPAVTDPPAVGNDPASPFDIPGGNGDLSPSPNLPAEPNDLLTDTAEPLDGVSRGIWDLAAHSDGRLLVGGHFAALEGTTAQSYAEIFPSGLLTTLEQHGDLRIRSVVALSDGRSLLAGTVVEPDRTETGYVNRILPDGAIDQSFQSNHRIDASVHRMVVQPDETIIVVGKFQTIDGHQSPGVAKLLANGEVDPGFVSPFAVGARLVDVVSLPEGQIIVAGRVTTATQALANQDSVTMLNAQGELQRVLGLAATVNRIALQPDGMLLVGGDFDEFSGQPAASLVRLSIKGEMDHDYLQNLGPGVEGAVHDLVVQPNGRLVVLGQFDRLGGHTRVGVGRLLLDGHLDDWDSGLSVAEGSQVGFSVALQSNGDLAMALTNSDRSHWWIARISSGLNDQYLPGWVSFGVDAVTTPAGNQVVIPLTRVSGNDGELTVRYSVKQVDDHGVVFGPEVLIGEVSWSDGDETNKTVPWSVPTAADTWNQFEWRLSNASEGVLFGRYQTLLIKRQTTDTRSAWQLEQLGEAVSEVDAFSDDIDFDQDGVSNLLEYALDRSPRKTGGTDGPLGLPKIGVVVNDAEPRLYIDLDLPLPARDDLIYEVCVSDGDDNEAIIARKVGRQPWSDSSSGASMIELVQRPILSTNRRQYLRVVDTERLGREERRFLFLRVILN